MVEMTKQKAEAKWGSLNLLKISSEKVIISRQIINLTLTISLIYRVISDEKSADVSFPNLVANLKKKAS